METTKSRQKVFVNFEDNGGQPWGYGGGSLCQVLRIKCGWRGPKLRKACWVGILQGGGF